MPSAQELIDDFAAQVAVHARLPVGSAAAYDAAAVVAQARQRLLRMVMAEAAEVARVRAAWQELRDQIDGAMT